tara:strand:+ start:713 stop:1138 length:426 start_codon:yes stop_codon:yes gene_type:complete
MKSVKLTNVHLFIILLLVSVIPVTEGFTKPDTSKTKDDDDDETEYGGSFGGKKGLYNRPDFKGSDDTDDTDDTDDEDDDFESGASYDPQLQQNMVSPTREEDETDDETDDDSGINFSSIIKVSALIGVVILAFSLFRPRAQ